MDDSNAIDLDTLTKPFPREALKQRSGGGKSLTYVETHTVIHRLNDATANRWDFRLTRFDLMGDTYVAVGELTIPGLGTRTGIGVQKVAERSGEDLVKGAASDCLKKCATLFGVALELYGPDFEAGEIGDRGAQPSPNNAPTPRPNPPEPTPIEQSKRAPNLAAVHAAVAGKVEGDAHGRAHALAEAAFGAPSMKALTAEQADLLRKAFGECRGPGDGEALIRLATRINAATATAELDRIADDIRKSGVGPERRALLSTAFLRVRQSVKDIEAAG